MNSFVNFVRVDGTLADNRPLIDRYGVKGFPTIKFFRGSKYHSTFTDERTADNIDASVRAILSDAARSARRPDGSFDVQANLPMLLKNLEKM